MLKYEYKNAEIYITKPNDKQLKNIRKATEVFLHKIIMECNSNDRNNN